MTFFFVNLSLLEGQEMKAKEGQGTLLLRVPTCLKSYILKVPNV